MFSHSTWYKICRSRQSHSTLNTERRNVNLHLDHWRCRIGKDIRPAEVQDWLDTISVGLRSKLRTLMSAIYRHAQKYEMLDRSPDSNPMPWVSASDLTSYEAVSVEPKEAFAILSRVASPLVRCLIVLVSATGLRISEALGLRWSDIDGERGRIYVRRKFVDGEIGEPKSAASRAPVEMHRVLATFLSEWRKVTVHAKDDDYIFASERMDGKQPRLGSMLSTDYVRPAALAAGVIRKDCPRFGLHNMRHGLASFLIDHGTDPVVVQRMLRHSRVSMTMHYTHARKRARKAQGKFLSTMLAGTGTGATKTPLREERRINVGAGDGI